MQILAPSFFINTLSESSSNRQLVIEVGDQYLVLLIREENSNGFLLAHYGFQESFGSEQFLLFFREIVSTEPWLKGTFSRSYLFYGTAQATLVPDAFFNFSLQGAHLELLFGDNNGTVAQNDLHSNHQYRTLYRVNSSLHYYLLDQFSYPTVKHVYSRIAGDELFDKQLCCFFNHQSFYAALFNKQQLQTIQQFPFATPEDAVYQLLLICQLHGCAPTETALQLYGFIDESSALYDTIYKYFSIISFVAVPEQYREAFESAQIPTHYFSHLFQS